jgi:acetyl-CoA acetyltransferase
MYGRPITIEDHQSSRFVVEPLRLLDCCLVSDGGAAVVITSAERARNLRKPPVYIAGIGQSHPVTDIGQRYPITETGAKGSGEMAFRMAGIEPKDVDVAEIYDCFTITVLMTLEEYGFCKKGEGGAFVEGGRIELGGELPVNTAGGLLSETGMPGMQLIVEAVRQLRGECGPRQVKDAKIAIVSNQGGIMTTHSTLILRR